MNAMLNRIGGRKFGLILLVFITTAVFLWFNVVSKDEFLTLTKMLLVAYPASAVGQAVLVKTGEQDEVDLAEKSDVRKFGFTILVFIVVSAMLYLQKLSGSVYIELNQWLVGMYLTGNVLAKVADTGLNITVGKK